MKDSVKRSITVVALLLPGLGLIVGFVGIVVVMAVVQSLGFLNFLGESGFSLHFWRRQLSNPTFWKAFFYSTRMAVIGAFCSVTIAYPIALWLRKPFPGSHFIASMIKIPLLIPGLVAAFLYVNLISHSGFINHGLMALGIIEEPLKMRNDPWGIGVIILQTWKNMPFALLLLAGAVRAIRDDVLDAAQDLGANIWARFRRVVAPLTLTSLQAALAIIFIGAAGDFSFQVIAGPIRLNSMAQYMMRQQRELGSWNDAAVVGVSLMVLALIGSAVVAMISRMIVKAGEK